MTRKGSKKELATKKFLVDVVYKDIILNDERDDIDILDNDWFVTDLCGKVHQVTNSKVESVRKSMEYWKDKQDTLKGKQYYSNMRYVYQQILLLMEGNREADKTAIFIRQ
jgi:hypothetical protein